MCRNIKPLFTFDAPVSDDEVRAAALQYVRKVSGFNKPSKANEAAAPLRKQRELRLRRFRWSGAAASSALLRSCAANAPPHDSEIEIARPARGTRRDSR